MVSNYIVLHIDENASDMYALSGTWDLAESAWKWVRSKPVECDELQCTDHDVLPLVMRRAQLTEFGDGVAHGRRLAVDEIVGRLTMDEKPLRGVEDWVLEIVHDAADGSDLVPLPF